MISIKLLPLLCLLPLGLGLQSEPKSGPKLDTTPEISRAAETLIVTPEQAAAVEAGLAWLAKHQNRNGSWTAKIGYKLNEDYNYTSDDRGHVGVTALAGMAFLAGGHLPGRGEYGKEVEHCLDFVLSCVDGDGYINQSGTRMYSHAFATIFMAEIYGMTHREDVRAKLQKAVDFVVRSQNADGGWRYEPYAVESDMSIIVCQVLALRAARNIGIRVPKATVDRAANYVVEAAVTANNQVSRHRSIMGAGNEIGSFRYQKKGHARSSFALTAAGVTALHGLGIYSDEAIQRGVEYLISGLSSFNAVYGNSLRENRRGHYFFWYGHYYGVQAMYQVGAPYWEPYFEEVRGLLLSMQKSDGSFPNGTGPGAAFGTAMGVLILEIPYRFLPIFQR